MAKAKNTRRKTKTTAKSKTKVSRGKASASRARKASNACCPVIKWKCEAKRIPGKAAESDKHIYESGRAPKDVLLSRGHDVHTCTVKMGSRKYSFKADSASDAKAGMSHKMDELKANLAAKRCMAVEAAWD